MPVPKTWQNGEAGGTPLDAAGLIDLEQRLKDHAEDYADTSTTTEATARASADAALDVRLDALEGDTTTIAEVPGLQAALDALQSAATAATDAEVTAAVNTLTTAINAKQDGATAATDSEVSAAVATLEASIALKQDAGTAATDAEVTAAIATVTTALGAKQPLSEKGQANGYASLGSDGLVPAAQLPASGGGGTTVVPIIAGNLGSAYTLDMLGNDEVRLFGTLNSSPLAVTTTGWKSGVSRAELVLLKTAGVARTVTIDGASIPIPTAAASVVVVLDTTDSGATIVVSVPGGDGPIGPTGPMGPGGPPIAAGRYWVNCPGTANTNQTAAANQEQCTPVEVPLDCTLDRIGVWVAVVGSAGALVRLGLRAFNGGYPGAVLLDAGTVDVTTLGFKSKTISLAVTAGWYFASVTQQGAPTTRAGLDGLPNNVAQRGSSVVTPFSGSTPSGFGQGSVSGALADPYTGTEATGSGLPRVYLRRA